MAQYRVTREIDIDGDSPRDAANKAMEIQRDPDSIATFFKATIPLDRVERRI